MNYTREHKENETSIIQSINQHECDGIAQMRGLRNFDNPSMWNLVRNHGTFTAEDAHKIGLIDYMPCLDPLDQLVDSTQSENDKEEMRKKLSYEITCLFWRSENRGKSATGRYAAY